MKLPRFTEEDRQLLENLLQSHKDRLESEQVTTLEDARQLVLEVDRVDRLLVRLMSPPTTRKKVGRRATSKAVPDTAPSSSTVEP